MVASKQVKALRGQDGKFLKGRSANPGGVPKGIRQLYCAIKKDFGSAYYKLGGLKDFMNWVKKHPRNKEKFYEMLVKMMPKEIIGEGFNQGTKILIVTSDQANKIKNDVEDIHQTIPRKVPIK